MFLLFYTNKLIWVRENPVCFYTLNIVSYTSNFKNNPKATTNFKEPTFVGII